MFHLTPNAIVNLDASHLVTEWNPGAEKDLRTSEKKYKTLIHTSPDAIALVDDTGRLVTVNSAMARRLGLDNQEPEGMRLHDLFSPESRSLQGWTRKGHLIVARELFRRLLRGWRISEKI